MEINKFSDIIGVLTKADIVEGRMVLLTGHDQSHDFGSREDLPGVKLPATAAEAAKATYLLVFAQDNRSLPIVSSQFRTMSVFALNWKSAGLVAWVLPHARKLPPTPNPVPPE